MEIRDAKGDAFLIANRSLCCLIDYESLRVCANEKFAEYERYCSEYAGENVANREPAAIERLNKTPTNSP